MLSWDGPHRNCRGRADGQELKLGRGEGEKAGPRRKRSSPSLITLLQHRWLASEMSLIARVCELCLLIFLFPIDYFCFY